jgi:hypothetical protein
VKSIVAERIVAIAAVGLAVLSCGCDSKESGGASASAPAPEQATSYMAPLPPSADPIPSSFVLPAFRPPPIVFYRATPEEARAVQDDAKKLNDALLAGDFATLLRLQHPAWIDKSGGPDRALEAMRAQHEQAVTRGMKVESLEFLEEPFFQKTSVREYVYVRTKKILTVGTERVEVVGFQLGARAIGDPTWTYVDGSGIKPGNINSLFPDFPADSVLPPVSRTKL